MAGSAHVRQINYYIKVYYRGGEACNHHTRRGGDPQARGELCTPSWCHTRIPDARRQDAVEPKWGIGLGPADLHEASPKTRSEKGLRCGKSAIRFRFKDNVGFKV